MNKKRILFPLGVLILLLGALAVCLKLWQQRRQPKMNLLLITLDTTRADHLSCYGYRKPTSPSLDALAQESAVFDFAIVQAPVTPVSHASILTGLRPYNHGLRVLHGLTANRLPENQETLAEVWRKNGGQAAAFVSAFPVTAAFGLDQGFIHFDADFFQPSQQELVSPRGTVNTGFSQRTARQTTDRAISWLQDAGRSLKPVFMWVHYFDPHDPLLLPPEAVLDELFAAGLAPSSESRADFYKAVYDCEIHYMDTHLGRLLDEFKKQGLWGTTIVVVVADHGEGLGDHDWWTHGILYQEQIRVPLLIRLPSLMKNIRIPSLVRTIDIMPTVLEAAGIRRQSWPEMDGRSLIDLIKGGFAGKARQGYSESVNMVTYPRLDTAGYKDIKDDKLYCIIEGEKKFIYHQLQPQKSELYNLKDDPAELDNRASRYPDEVVHFLSELERLRAFSDIMPGMTPTDKDRLDKLKSLGYVQ
jgi:arylsulfatase A-like enzyme